MKLTRIVTGEDNRSHFEDLEIPLAPVQYVRMSELLPAFGVIFWKPWRPAHWIFIRLPAAN